MIENEELDVSIIIPCYNEIQVIKQNVPIIKELMDATKFTYEIILYDDFSTDGTKVVGAELAQKNSGIRWMAHERNYGRGRTVKDGILASKGKIVGFIDMDLEVQAANILPMIIAVQNGADMAIGNRCISSSWLQNLPLYVVPKYIVYWFSRFTLSLGYAFLVKCILGVKLNDTEIGLKFFKKDRILPILLETKDEGWFWDTEIMTRAYYGGFRIFEYPVLFLKRFDKKSTVRIVNDTFTYFEKIIKFRKEILPKIKEKSKVAI